jgi:replication factor C subunit 3/5
MSKIPWVEFYRPSNFNDIVLDPLNKKILNNILKTSYFPNLLFYGPPGTGKTTTIINLINVYLSTIGNKNKDLIIHLNASDERGIDIIRNQIFQFVNSKPFFRNGVKFVVLDEVDYMTKNAQQALKYLLQEYTQNVRFCLICNYISKIDEGLQNEFLKMRFNQLPGDEIVVFLKKISESEKLNIDNNTILRIQSTYKSDIRSMINYIQSNQEMLTHFKKEINIIDDSIWDTLLVKVFNTKDSNEEYFYNISKKYNMDIKNIILGLLNYIIRKKKNMITADFLNFVENLLHSSHSNNKIYMHYFLIKLSSFC